MELDLTYAELDPGSVGAAVLALAETLEVPRVATTDRRDFEPLAGPDILDPIRREADRFTGRAPADDDRTIIIIELTR